jgi:predicted nucleic acid-binding protein
MFSFMLTISQRPLHLSDVKDVLEAIEIQQRYELSFWDALIICSAKKSGCDVIW